jgi:saccharopine dehydrogenase-like NADP-dependent oxidoreductase
VFPYSAQTIVEEMTLPPWVFERGRFRRLKPRTRWERVDFGKPVGAVWTVCTRHSEIATLPLSLRAKGISHCDFKVNFDRAFVTELVRRMKTGWTARDFAKLPAPRGRPDDVEVARVIVEGGGRRIVMDCRAAAKPGWHASAGDIDTGCPPSIVAQMIAGGMIQSRGALAPEEAVPAGPFFDALRKRGMRITEKRT